MFILEAVVYIVNLAFLQCYLCFVSVSSLWYEAANILRNVPSKIGSCILSVCRDIFRYSCRMYDTTLTGVMPTIRHIRRRHRKMSYLYARWYVCESVSALSSQ